MTTTENPPATRDEAATALDAPAAPAAPAAGDAESTPAAAPRQRISVAFLPLALIAFVVLVLIAAAWTFLATTA